MGLLDEYLAHLALTHPDSTVATYRSALGHADRLVPAGLASANTDELHAAIVAGNPMPATRALRRAAVVGFFRWAADPARPRLDFDPSQYLPRVRVPRRSPRPAGTDTLGHILRLAQRPYRDWILLAAYAGLRCCEIAALDTGHVDRQSIWVHGKGGHERVVPTHPLVWDMIKALPPGPVARGTRTVRCTRQEVSKRANVHLAGLAPGVTMHRLRHWFATHSLESCGDLRVVQELLGHASPATTAIYTEVATSRMASAVAALPEFSPADEDAAGTAV